MGKSRHFSTDVSKYISFTMSSYIPCLHDGGEECGVWTVGSGRICVLVTQLGM